SNQRAADTLITELERRIVSGELEHDKPLPAERDLMEEFNSSRTVVREAISALASRGLVESRPRFRPIVRKPNYGTILNATGNIVQHLLAETGGIKNLYKSREFVERGLVRHAALNATKEDIAELKAALAANCEALEDTPKFFVTDMAFHAVLYRILRNPIFPVIHQGYVSWLAPNWERMERPPEHNQTNYIAHKAIFDAILERDPDKAEEAVIKHLTEAWEFVKDTLNPAAGQN
ncbi:UNVERIFIED_CONTAM: hypothetical protein GTU68_003123, partial [Idotea baltica]|nr:hypothetical protein [Idotea baltica]